MRSRCVVRSLDVIPDVISQRVFFISGHLVRERFLRRRFLGQILSEYYCTEYMVRDACVTVFEWPGIPSFVEIAGDDPPHVRLVLSLLNLDEEAVTNANTTKIYERYGIDVRSLRQVIFADEPVAQLPV